MKVNIREIYENIGSEEVGFFAHNETGGYGDTFISISFDWEDTVTSISSLWVKKHTGSGFRWFEVLKNERFCDIVEFFFDHTKGMFPDYEYFENTKQVRKDFEAMPKFFEVDTRTIEKQNELSERYLLDFQENMLNAVIRANFKACYQTEHRRSIESIDKKAAELGLCYNNTECEHKHSIKSIENKARELGLKKVGE